MGSKRSKKYSWLQGGWIFVHAMTEPCNEDQGQRQNKMMKVRELNNMKPIWVYFAEIESGYGRSHYRKHPPPTFALPLQSPR